MVDFVRGTRKVVIGVFEGNFGLVRTCADLERLAPDSPIRVGIVVAVIDVAQVVNVRVEICRICFSILNLPLATSLSRLSLTPITSDVVERVILEHQVDDVLDLWI